MHWGRQCAAPTNLLDAGPSDVLKCTSPSLGAGVNAFFCSISRLQGVKNREDLLKMRGFQCIRGRSVPPPPSCRTLGQGMRQKARRLALAEEPMQFFGVVSCWQNVKICEGLLEIPNFQCIGGGSVPPPISCRTLGWVARRKARRLALVKA